MAFSDSAFPSTIRIHQNRSPSSAGGIFLPDRDYYIVDNAHFATIRSQYIEHMKKMFTLAGDSPDQSAKEAAAVMEIETAMAKDFDEPYRSPPAYEHLSHNDSRTTRRPGPRLQVERLLSRVGIGQFDTLNVSTPDFFKSLSGMIKSEPLDSWKSYLRWQVLHGQAQQMPKAFFDENFAFFNKTLSGQDQPQARWKQCSSLTDASLGEAVGQDWVRQNFPPAAKESMDKLVLALEKAMGEDLQTLPWMGDDTKKAAEEKLAMIRNKIGYPEKWKDYSTVKVNRDELIENVEHVAVFDRDYNFHKLGKPVDEKEWGMTPPTVNAYYADSFNDINFPAGILQPPFFDVNADPAVNFGGIGTVIGHEMTHGFDDQGAQYDGKGNLRQWQTDADLKAFNERTECVAGEYGGFQAAPAEEDAPAQNLNGHLTLGENTADNGGLRIAFMALQDTLAPSTNPPTKKSMASLRLSDTSSPSARTGARTTPTPTPARPLSSIRILQANGVSTAACRTSTSSARSSAAKRVSPCTQPTLAASGKRHSSPSIPAALPQGRLPLSGIHLPLTFAPSASSKCRPFPENLTARQECLDLIHLRAAQPQK